MEIITGKQKSPLKAVIYGVEGIGKSTLASQFPNPLFIDLERGTNQLDVARIHLESLAEITQLIANLEKDTKGYQTLVFDTADWLESLVQEDVCRKAGKTSIEDFGYGKGFTIAGEAWKKLVDRLSRLSHTAGLNIVFLAHAQMKRQELPEESGGFDRWEMKMSKQGSALLKEWPDLLLFCNYKTIIVENDGKKKAKGAERVMYSAHHACWDAKNRFQLPKMMKLGIEPLKALFSFTAPAKAESAKTEATTEQTATKSAGTTENTKPDATAKTNAVPESEELRQLNTLMEMSGVSAEQLQAEVEKKGITPKGTPYTNYHTDLLKRIISGWEIITKSITK